MRIAGNRVILRTAEAWDKEMLIGLIQEPEMAKVTGGYPSPLSYEHQMSWFCSRPQSAGELRSIIADKENPQAGLGILLLSQADCQSGAAEIYIKLRRSVRGKGYGQDAVNTLVDYAFRELHLTRIRSRILEHNTASRKLFEKCGFQQTGTYQSRGNLQEYCRNVCAYEIINQG